MKKLLAVAAAVAAFSAQADTLTVAATPVPHAEILNFVKPQLAKEGVELKVKEFTDYIQPNVQVAEKRLDANFFQHQPYLDEFNKAKGTQLVSVAGVHIEPLGVYSSKIKKLDELSSGATVVIPNDATNGGRALLLLDKAGVIKLKDNKNILSTVKDVAENPKNVKFRELEAATIPRVLTQVDAALINTNYALEAKLNPEKDALAIEGSDSPYVNILVARPDNKDSDDMKKLAAALHSPEVKQFIIEKYKGAVFQRSDPTSQGPLCGPFATQGRSHKVRRTPIHVCGLVSRKACAAGPALSIPLDQPRQLRPQLLVVKRRPNEPTLSPIRPDNRQVTAVIHGIPRLAGIRRNERNAQALASFWVSSIDPATPTKSLSK